MTLNPEKGCYITKGNATETLKPLGVTSRSCIGILSGYNRFHFIEIFENQDADNLLNKYYLGGLCAGRGDLLVAL